MKFNQATNALIFTAGAMLLQSTHAVEGSVPPRTTTPPNRIEASVPPRTTSPPLTCTGDLTSDLVWDKEACPAQLIGSCKAGHPQFPCAAGTSCFDCDPCQAHNFDCGGCATSGCFYCPGDGLCRSQAVGEAFFSQFGDNWETMSQPKCTRESDWTTNCDASPTTNGDRQVFNDPAYQYQSWAFDLLNVAPVWLQGITGRGVVVRVNDPHGVDSSHPEFYGRFDEQASCPDYLPPDMAPTTWDGMPASRHGTTVASLAVGAGNNNECAVGIAPGATLSACLGPSMMSMPESFFEHGLDTTHVSVNSWGFDACHFTDPPANPEAEISLEGRNGGGRRRMSLETCPFVLDVEENPCKICSEGMGYECEMQIREYCGKHSYFDISGCSEALDLFVDCNFNALSDVGRETLTRGITQGRNGKGIIYTVAAGNEYSSYEDVNFEGWLNTRFTIVVAAVGKDGKHASYSSTGAAVFVSGPGGDSEDYVNNVAALAGGGCYSADVGTSFSTPQVAGAIALVLEANPSLGWRDVQAVLATTSKKTDPMHPSWVTNGAGLFHSDFYGFGLMDTAAAVETAKDWINLPPEDQIMVDSGAINAPIADNELLAVQSKATVNPPGTFVAESVAVYLQVEHASRGNLEVILTSPSGTKSILSAGIFRESQQLTADERWKLMTVKNFGEDASGDWILSVTDKKEGNYLTPGSCVDGAYFHFHEELGLFGCEAFAENAPLCSDPAMLNFEGVAPTDLCCACGGSSGMTVPLENKLISWSLVVYGHSYEMAEGEQASYQHKKFSAYQNHGEDKEHGGLRG